MNKPVETQAANVTGAEAVVEMLRAHGGPSLVDIVCQPLHEAKAPVSEWVA